VDRWSYLCSIPHVHLWRVVEPRDRRRRAHSAATWARPSKSI